MAGCTQNHAQCKGPRASVWHTSRHVVHKIVQSYHREDFVQLRCGFLSGHTGVMGEVEVGKLVSVDVHVAWPHEALAFTPWLADNLDELADVIGIPLELQGTEVHVGSFAADILATDASTGTGVLIENQLTGSDHKHLGQIMTYLAGLDVSAVVWIATSFTEPHLSAINWLNEHSDDGFSFFAVRLSAVRIGDSAIAPMLTVEARPNNWERDLALAAKVASGQMSEIGQARQAFWEALLERYPNLHEGRDANALSSRWYAVEGTDLYVVLYKSAEGGGVFLRGPRGEPREQTYTRLQGVADEIQAGLGDGSGEGYSRWIHDDDQAAVHDWLNEMLQRYRAAVSEVVTSGSSEQ